MAFPELPDDRRAQPRRYAPADSAARTQTPPDGWRGPDVGEPEDDGGRGRGWGGALPEGLDAADRHPVERLGLPGVMRRSEPGAADPGPHRATGRQASGSSGWVNGVWLGMGEAVGYGAQPAGGRPPSADEPSGRRRAEDNRSEQATEEFVTGGFGGQPAPGRPQPNGRPPQGPDPRRRGVPPAGAAPQWAPTGPPAQERTGATEIIPAAPETAETEAIPRASAPAPARRPDPAPQDLRESPVEQTPGDETLGGGTPGGSAEPDPDADGIPGRHRRRAGASPEGKPAASYLASRRPDGRKPRTGRRRRPTFWKELPLLIVVALVLTFLIQTFLAKVYVIPSGSMETTLHGCTGCNNDRVLVDKVTFRFSDPAPGDVVVFRGPDSWSNTEFSVAEPTSTVGRIGQEIGSLIGLAPPDEKDFVKRVIAVGGQTVACCDSRNRVMVDNQPLDEPYIYYLPAAGPARQIPFGPITVPDGELWVMGDSRNNSSDSRIDGHGPIPVANVIGKARLKVLPISRFGWIDATNPQTSQAVGLGSGAPEGAPLALGVLGAVPFALLRRRRIRFDEHVGEFLPTPRRSRFRRGGS